MAGPGGGTPARPGFRPDIQGLRAVAVSLVVVYHLFPHRVPGGYIGVDVFFVISGFLITGHLLRNLERTGRVGFTEFYARRARRLMPAALLVLVVVWVLSRAFLPATQLADVARQVRASALYFQNWVLAGDAVNYLTADNAPTPVQHFWSLSVEEQFYLGWPLLFLLAAGAGLLAARRRRAAGDERAAAADRARAGRVALLVLAGLVVAASLWFSVHETRVNPAAAYFVTTTRIWELAAGGALALLPRRVADRVGRLGILAWAGLAMVLVAAFRFTDSTPFPGVAALLPVGGAVLLIACGAPSARLGPARLTTLRPMVFLGDISYSLYLWHWPVIVIWRAVSGRTIGLPDGVALAVGSVLLAWATKVLVEDRFRLAPFFTRHRWRSLATVTGVVVPVTLASVYLSAQPTWPTGRAGAANIGAAALAPLPQPTSGRAAQSPAAAPLPRPVSLPTAVTAPLSPPLILAPRDFQIASSRRCQTPALSTEVKHCIIGDKAHPTLQVALVGDSVAGMWSSALNAIGRRLHWRIDVMTHSGCPWSSTMMVHQGMSSPYTACRTWGEKVLATVLQERPAVVITSDRPTLAIANGPPAGPAARARIGAGMVPWWTTLLHHGIGVVGIVEGPEMGSSVPDCLAAIGGNVTKCSRPRSEAVLRTSPVSYAGQRVPGAHVVDLTSLICTPTVCPPVIGNVIVYRDDHHLTKTYSMTLAPYLQQDLLATGLFTAHH